MQKYFCLIIFMICIQESQAQQLPLFTQYRENHSLINPSLVHHDYMAKEFTPENSAGISYRYQWAGLDIAPRTYTARYEHVFSRMNFLVGGSLIKDDLGPLSSSGVFLRYAFLIELDKRTNSFISVGVATGFMQQRFHPDQGVLIDAGDVFGMTPETVFYTDFNIGGYWKQFFGNDHYFYTGLSIPQLFFTKITASDDIISLNKVPHFYSYSGAQFDLSDGLIQSVEPSVWLKYVTNVPLHADFNVLVQFDKFFWLGFGYGTDYSDKFRGNNFHFEAGISLNIEEGRDDSVVKIGYGFDQNITTYGPRLGSTHELNLTYSW